MPGSSTVCSDCSDRKHARPAARETSRGRYYIHKSCGVPAGFNRFRNIVSAVDRDYVRVRTALKFALFLASLPSIKVERDMHVLSRYFSSHTIRLVCALFVDHGVELEP